MTTTTLETSSCIDDHGARNQTRRGRSEDWVLPEIEQGSWSLDETTTADKLSSSSSNGSATTRTRDIQEPSEPIRRDNFGVQFSNHRIKLLQQWECVVSRVNEDSVECEMHDLTDESMPVEYAEVYLDEFSVFDRSLLCEGAVFYWSIGHETKMTGQIRRYSELRVRRMPSLSNFKKREIKDKAKYLSELFANRS